MRDSLVARCHGTVFRPEGSGPLSGRRTGGTPGPGDPRSGSLPRMTVAAIPPLPRISMEVAACKPLRPDWSPTVCAGLRVR